MSIAVLNEVYDETRRLAIAGSGLASDDFRLKKLVAPLEKAGAKAPVFAKVAAAIQKVVEGPAKESAESLLELSTLVTAILYTQGETGLKGKAKAIETSNLGIPTSDASARVLKPLIEALTTTGSGRLEIIRDAHQRGAFRDLRLVKPAVAAIDDVYPEIGDFVADNVLPIFGKAIYPELRQSFDPKGKGGHVRRLRLMYQLDPKLTEELVEQALESGSKEVTIAALACLKNSKEHLSYLLEQTKSKLKDVRRAALQSIAPMKDKEVVAALVNALSGTDLEIATHSASQNPNPQLLTFLLEDAQRQLDELFTIKAKAKLKKPLQRFHVFLDCFSSRNDKKTEAFLLNCFDRRDDLAKLKGDTDGKEINRRVASLLVSVNSKVGQRKLVEAHATLDESLFRYSVFAALRTCKPKQVYDTFSPYYTAKLNKGRNPAKSKRDDVAQALMDCSKDYESYGYYGHYHGDSDYLLQSEVMKEVKLDPGWLDAAVETVDLDTVMALARPKHKPTLELLAKTMDDGLKKKGGDIGYELARVLETMIQIQHPGAVDYFVTTLKTSGTNKRRYSYYSAYWICRLIPDLPQQAFSRITELLPNLNDKAVDAVAPYLNELKQRQK